MPIIQSDYEAPSWARGTHLQTILPAKLSRKPHVGYRREHWDTPDGDFQLFDWAKPEPQDPKAPIAVMFHGLEGDSSSHYAVAFMHEAARRGWRGVIPLFRSCGGVLNRLPRSYYAGDTESCAWTVERIHSLYPEAPIYIAGVSIGGNYVTKYAGDMGLSVPSCVKAVVAVGAPLDLVNGSALLAEPLVSLYGKMFLSTLREKVEQKIRVFGDFIDVERFRRVKTIPEFDEVYTAPVHGFRDSFDYWTRCGGKSVLKSVAVPMLLINPLNDPFQAVSSLPTEADISNFVYLEQPAEGGHIGFPTGKWPGDITWLPNRIFGFFDAVRGVSSGMPL